MSVIPDAQTIHTVEAAQKFTPGRAKPYDLISLTVLTTLVFTYLLTRSLNLSQLAPFVDELIYTNLAYNMRYLPTVPLLWSGHGPLYPLTETMAQLGFGIQDLVLGGRVAAVLAGLATLFIVYALGSKLWNRAAGLAATVLFVLCPFNLTYNRMALTESIQTLYMLAAVYLSICLAASVRQSRLKLAGLSLLLGVVLGGTMLIKLNSLLVVSWCGLALLLLGGVELRPRRKFLGSFKINWRLWLAFGVSLALGAGIFALQLGAPDYFSSELTGLQFPLRDVFLSPGTTWWPRLFNFVLPTLVAYLSWPVLVLLVLALLAVGLGLTGRIKQIDRQQALAASVPAGAALIALALPVLLISANLPRYLITGLSPLLLLGGWFLSLLTTVIWQKLGNTAPTTNQSSLSSSGLALLVSLAALPFFVTLLTNPPATPFPKDDKYQFVNGWPSGYGLDELTKLIRQETTDWSKPVQLVIVGAQQQTIYEVYQHLAAYPDRQRNVGIPPNFSTTAILAHKVPDRHNRSIFHYPEPQRDRKVLALVEGDREQLASWKKFNPDFEYVLSYDGPAETGVKYEVYRHLPSSNKTGVSNVSKVTAGPADLSSRLRFGTDNRLADQLSYEVSLKNNGPGTAAGLTLIMPLNPYLTLSHLNFNNPEISILPTKPGEEALSLALPLLEAQQIITGTLVFNVAKGVPPELIQTRVTLKWNDETADERSQASNSLSLAFVKPEAALVSKALLENASSEPSVPAQVLEETATSFKLSVTRQQPGFVVLTTAYYPGWKAKVNGLEKPLLRANYAFNAVEVGAGQSTVKIYYEPDSFRYSALAGLLTLGLIVALASLRWYQKTRQSAS